MERQAKYVVSRKVVDCFLRHKQVCRGQDVHNVIPGRIRGNYTRVSRINKRPWAWEWNIQTDRRSFSEHKARVQLWVHLMSEILVHVRMACDWKVMT